MQQINYATFPTLLDDLDALQEEIDSMLKRSILLLGGIVLPCAGFVLYMLSSAGQ